MLVYYIGLHEYTIGYLNYTVPMETDVLTLLVLGLSPPGTKVKSECSVFRGWEL